MNCLTKINIRKKGNKKGLPNRSSSRPKKRRRKAEKQVRERLKKKQRSRNREEKRVEKRKKEKEKARSKRSRTEKQKKAGDREEERKKMEDGEEEKQNRDRYTYLEKRRRASSLRKKQSTVGESGASAGRARVWSLQTFRLLREGGLAKTRKRVEVFLVFFFFCNMSLRYLRRTPLSPYASTRGTVKRTPQPHLKNGLHLPVSEAPAGAPLA